MRPDSKLDRTFEVLMSEQSEAISEVLFDISESETVQNMAEKIIAPLMLGQTITEESKKAVGDSTRSIIYTCALLYLAGRRDATLEANDAIR